MDGSTWVIVGVVAALLALIFVYIQSILKVKPLVVDKVLKFTTNADLPDEPADVAVCAQCGMRGGEGGETLARIDWQEKTQVLLRARDVQIPESQRQTSLGIMLYFNTDQLITYPAQTIRLLAEDFAGNNLDVSIDLPDIPGKDGENAYFYLDAKGRAYWATRNHQRARVPDMDAASAMKKEHRVYTS